MRPRWIKVFHDLWDNKARTLLVVLSIAVGVFSIGVIAGAYAIILNDMSVSYAANNPANIEIRTTNFDADMLASIQNVDGVLDAEGRRVVNLRVKTNDDERWVSLDVMALESFSDIRINLMMPVSGAREPGEDEILLEKEALEKVNVGVGDTD